MKSTTKQKLTKSNNRVISGVLGGIAEYLNWNANVLRVLFVILSFVTHGLGILIYLLLMTIIPSKPENTGFFEQMRRGTATQEKSAKHGRKAIHDVHEEDEPRHQD